MSENVPDGWHPTEQRGIQHERDARADFSAAFVGDYETHEQMAAVHGRIDPDEYAVLLNALGLYYNTAHLAVEANAVGQAVVGGLTNALLYPNLHFHQPRMNKPANFNRPGFWTSATGWYSKTEQVECLRKHIRDWTWIPHDCELIQECQSYEIDYTQRRNARYGVAAGGHDDRVSAAMICLRVMEHPQCEPLKRSKPDFYRQVADAGIVPERVERDPWKGVDEGDEATRLSNWIHS